MFKLSVMTFTLFAVCLKSTLGITEEQRDHIQNQFLLVGAECIKEHPLTIDDLASFKNRVFPEGENAGCFSACIFHKLGIFDDKGTLSHQTALENARKVFENEDELETIEAFLNTCSKVNDEEVSDGEEGCERAKLAYDCFIQNYEHFGFDIDF